MALPVLGVFFLVGSTASAQWDPEGGDTGQWQAPPAGQQQQPPQQQQQQQQPPQQQGWQQQQQPQQQGQQQQGQQQGWFQQQETETPPAGGSDDDDSDADDHMAVVGHMGVGWFGLQSIPFPLDRNPDPDVEDLSLPVATIGIRYWLSESLGLDLALGMGVATGTLDTENNPGDSDSVDLPGFFVLDIHGALPIALYHGGHYKFLFIPELDIGFGTGDDGQSNGAAWTGFVFRAGARAGAEVHFGFIDIPQLSIQATVGIAFSFASMELDWCPSGNCDAQNQIVTQNIISFGTDQFNEPWDILTSQVAAIYYF
jgi:hypothetical protein